MSSRQPRQPRRSRQPQQPPPIQQPLPTQPFPAQPFPAPPPPKKNSKVGCLLVLAGLVVLAVCAAGAFFLSFDIWKSITGTFASSATATPISVQAGGTLRVHYIDIGQGDSILIQGPRGSTMLIDGGERDSGALEYLQALGIRRINILVATHPHADHIGGLIEILRRVPVDEVVTNGESHTTQTYEQFLDGIIASKAKFTEVDRGDTLTLDGLTFRVLNPDPGDNFDEDELNEGSVVLRTEYGPTSFLFTGDAEREAESSMIASGMNLQATILKAGHHGSRTSSTSAFLAKVQPEVAIYSAAIDNDYGHPHESTLDNLARAGATVYGTDEYGTIVVTANSEGYTIETEK